MSTCNQWKRPLEIKFRTKLCFLPLIGVACSLDYRHPLQTSSLDANGSRTTPIPDATRVALLKCNSGCVVSSAHRRKRPWCTTPSTWWRLPLNAPLRSPSALCSATDTNPGASDHASWTCSKTWVRNSGLLSVVIHPWHPSLSLLAASPVSSGRGTWGRRIGESDDARVCGCVICLNLSEQRGWCHALRVCFF